MTEQISPLATFYKPGWEQYQQALVQAIAALSSEQLALSVAPDQRSIGELLDHMIGARFNWFHLWMGEGDPGLSPGMATGSRAGRRDCAHPAVDCLACH